MTNTLKHLALLARMESSGLKLGLTGKFPEDALDQTCERVETFQLQNRLRTGNDNTQIQKELVRTPEFAALYHALCNDGVDDRSITSMLQSAIACDEQLTQYPKEQVLAAAGTDMFTAPTTESAIHSLLAASTPKSHAGRSAAHSTASGPRPS